MKRTVELTFIHYRRWVKKPASPAFTGATFSHCPVCGTALEAIVPKGPEDPEGLKPAQRFALQVAEQSSVSPQSTNGHGDSTEGQPNSQAQANTKGAGSCDHK
jgi:hypothetical protein